MPNSSSNLKSAGKRQYGCFFDLTIDVLCGKWKAHVLYRLAVDGTLRFSELRRKMPKTTDRMLIRQLRELEQDGLVNRTVTQVIPPKVEYALSEQGRSLIPILEQMRQWGVTFEQYLRTRTQITELGDRTLSLQVFQPSRLNSEERRLAP